MSNKINLSKCELDDYIPVNENDELDDSLNGKYGYRVFYNVPLEDIRKSGYFTEDQMPGDDFVIYGAQIEFTVDSEGKQVGEVLLWLSVEDFEEDCIENTEFVNFNEDISSLVDDFVNLFLL